MLEAWSGLGYYRRARLLHEGARFVAEHHGGVVPQTPDALRSIPGVGPYTAGAIGSIAFDRPVPLVDGNVARVLSRILAIEDVREQAATARGHWTTVERIVRHGSPRVLAQALMELGATVCTPRSPRCEACPVAAQCGALARGLVDAIPAVKVKAASPLQRWWALAIERDGRVLSVRREDEGLLAGLWCLPLVEIPDGGDPRTVDAAAIAAVIEGTVRVGGNTGDPVVHTFTHRVWEMHPVIVTAEAPVALRGIEASRIDWLAPRQKPVGGLPTLTRKLLARIGHGAK